MDGLKGLTAVVTGAGSGLGKSVALRLVSLGAHVVLCGRTESKLQVVAEEAKLQNNGGIEGVAKIYRLDVSSQGDVEGLAKMLASSGGLDILINNAGLLVNKSMEETSVAEFDKVMATNVRGPFMMCKYLLPLLKESPAASIINIGSAASHNAYPNQTAYGASKHALLGMSKSLAREVYKDGVRVHVICPGGIATGMLTGEFSGVRSDLKGQNLIVPDNISDIVEFLLTHRSHAVIDEIAVRRSGKEPWPYC